MPDQTYTPTAQIIYTAPRLVKCQPIVCEGHLSTHPKASDAGAPRMGTFFKDRSNTSLE